VTGIPNIKPGLRVLFVIAALAAALAIPAYAGAAQQGCADAGTDPTAAQYCQVAGVHTSSGNNKPDTKAANDAGTSPETAPVADVSPVATEAVESSSSSSLPFTGLDVGILAAVAAALTGTGLVLRRLTASGVPRS
jgi:hypothetical protein